MAPDRSAEFSGLPAAPCRTRPTTPACSPGLPRKGTPSFELLVWRHGGMVFGVARRILGDVHAAEDVFQATFLALARQAKSVRKDGCVAAWLHRVARRVAMRAKKASGGRQAPGFQNSRNLGPDAPRSPEIRLPPRNVVNCLKSSTKSWITCRNASAGRSSCVIWRAKHRRGRRAARLPTGHGIVPIGDGPRKAAYSFAVAAAWPRRFCRR